MISEITAISMGALIGFLVPLHHEPESAAELVYISLPGKLYFADCVCTNTKATKCQELQNRALTVTPTGGGLITCATLDISNFQRKPGECSIPNVCTTPKPCRTEFDLKLTIHSAGPECVKAMGGNGLYLVIKDPVADQFASPGNPATLPVESDVDCQSSDCNTGGQQPAEGQAFKPAGGGPSTDSIAELHVRIFTLCSTCKSMPEK